MALVRQSASLYNRVKGKQMNEAPNEFFARLIAHNQVVQNIEEEAARKEAMHRAGVEAIERARNFA
jgi:hypothetical protein